MGVIFRLAITMITTLLAGVGVGELADKFGAKEKVPGYENPYKDGAGINFKKIGLIALLSIIGVFIVKKLQRMFKFKILFAAFAVIITGLLLAGVLPDNGITYAVLVGTAAGGIGTPFLFRLDYIPQWIYWNDGGNAINQLVIESIEDGVYIDATAAAIAAMRGYQQIGAIAANNQLMPCASGRIRNKTVQVRGTTSAAGAINFFANSDNLDGVPYKLKSMTALANTPTTVTNFAALFLPNLLAGTDRLEVLYQDSQFETYDPAELATLSVQYQDAPAVILNNINGAIKRATITDVAGGLFYMLSYDIKIGA